MKLTCDGGLPGFEDTESYELLEQDGPGPFRWLRATSGSLAFIVVDPRLFWPDYSPDLSPRDLESLGMDSASEGCLCVIVTVPDDPMLATANLFAPIVFNPRSGKLGQFALSGSGYALSEYLFPEYVRRGKAGLTSACADAPRR